MDDVSLVYESPHCILETDCKHDTDLNINWYPDWQGVTSIVAIGLVKVNRGRNDDSMASAASVLKCLYMSACSSVRGKREKDLHDGSWLIQGKPNESNK